MEEEYRISLWVNTKDGKTYISGKDTAGQQFTMWDNRGNKKTDNSPDFVIKKSLKKSAQGGDDVPF